MYFPKLLIIFGSGLVSGLVTASIFNFLSPQGSPQAISPLTNRRSDQAQPQALGFVPFWLIEQSSSASRGRMDTLAYFALQIGDEGKIVKLVNPQEEEPGWTMLKSDSLKEVLNQAGRDKTKLSLVIHLNNEAKITNLLNNPEKHAQNLVDDALPLMKEYSFADLNLDIESFQKRSAEDQQKFAAFVSTVNRRLKSVSNHTLTIEIPPISLIKPRLTSLDRLVNKADYFVLMAYDYHYLGSSLAGPVAPLAGAGFNREYDVQTAVSEALKMIPKEKLILGIPLYGYEWETLSSHPGSPVIPGSGATASHRRINKLLSSCAACQTGFDELSQETYLIFQDQGLEYYHQVFYEDQEGLKAKLALAKMKKLAGLAFWALGYEDDFFLSALDSY